MRKSVLFSVIFLSSLVSMAQSVVSVRPANIKQTKYICKTIDQMMIANDVDAAIDMQACLANKKIKAVTLSDGATALEGRISFQSIAQPRFKLSCQLGYVGSIEKPKLISDSFDCQ